MSSASQDRPDSPSLTLAAAQSVSIPGDVPRNVEHHLEFARLAVEHGADLLVFPELSMTGYELELAGERALMPDSPELGPLGRFAAESGMTIVAGAPLKASSARDLHLGALVFRPDGVVLPYSKQHVHEHEARVFVTGVGGPVFEVGGRLSGWQSAGTPSSRSTRRTRRIVGRRSTRSARWWTRPTIRRRLRSWPSMPGGTRWPWFCRTTPGRAAAGCRPGRARFGRSEASASFRVRTRKKH